MDPTKQRSVTQERDELPGRHDMVYDVHAAKLRVLQSWPFEKTFKSECKLRPSTWKLKIEILEVREDGTTSLSITLKRSDSQNGGLDANVHVKILDAQRTKIYDLEEFYRDGMVSGDVMERTTEMTPFPAKREAINDKVVLRIRIMVSDCCPERDPDL